MLWDSGSGSGSVTFLNYDYIEDDLRRLIREPKFRQAISHAFNREAVRKSVYFNTGEPTTGTLSPKAAEFNVDDSSQQLYADWRDAYLAYDPDKAKALLDELGVKDSDGDGIRELPNGKKLELRLDYHSDESSEHRGKDSQLVADLEAVGLKMVQNPIPPQSYDDQWLTGTLMSRTNWEVGDGHPLIYTGWIVPVNPSHWAPLQGQWFQQLGTGTNDKELDLDPWKRHPPRMEAEPEGPVQKLWDLFNAAKVEADELKRHGLVWEIFKIHISDGPFFMGCVANYPQVMVIKTGLRNVPRNENLALGGWVNPWIHPVPAVYDPECYYWDVPEEHS